MTNTTKQWNSKHLPSLINEAVQQSFRQILDAVVPPSQMQEECGAINSNADGAMSSGNPVIWLVDQLGEE